MTISIATSDADLQVVRRLFAETFPGIARDAVPFTGEGQQTFDVLVAQALDPDGGLEGAAMACRARIAVLATMMEGDPLGYSHVVDKLREIDLIAVQPALRGSGLGSKLLAFLEEYLARSGIEVLIGNATQDLDVDSLRQFYERNEFTVCKAGAPLPRLLGKTWTHPNAEQPAFYFYKFLGDPLSMHHAQPPQRPKVVPPDPKKARHPKRSRKVAGRRR